MRAADGLVIAEIEKQMRTIRPGYATFLHAGNRHIRRYRKPGTLAEHLRFRAQRASGKKSLKPSATGLDPCRQRDRIRATGPADIFAGKRVFSGAPQIADETPHCSGLQVRQHQESRW